MPLRFGRIYNARHEKPPTRKQPPQDGELESAALIDQTTISEASQLDCQERRG